jgi:hypothetical protein
MKTRHTDVAAEYLAEVDRLLAGIPVLQRRELIADLRTHIETERAERNLSEAELIDVLERLGSPEVVAAAAHDEAEAHRAAGPPPMVGGFPPLPTRSRRPWPAFAIAGVVVFLVLAFCGLATVRGDSGSSIPAPVETPAHQFGPEPVKTP